MRKTSKKYNFVILYPKLAKEWDYEKNYPLIPEDVTPHSHKKVWWKCRKCEGERLESLSERVRANRHSYCRRCNSLAIKNPKLVKEWHPTKNGKLTPYDVSHCSGKKVWWIDKYGHEYPAKISHRNSGRGCPYCSGKKVSKDNCLATLNPKLASEWHPTKNGKLTPYDVTRYSAKTVLWIDKYGHEYPSPISGRSQGRGCPYCDGKKINKDNCLATLNPKLASEWHPTKNGKLTPYDVTPNSHKKVWWIDQKKHEYISEPHGRSRGIGCFRCNGIELKNGVICTSLPEAYYYLKLKAENVQFEYHVKIGLSTCSCDFYVPYDNKYIEVTSYTKTWKRWKTYYKNILKKKKHVTKVLKAKFKFIQLKLTPKQIQYVGENSV